MTALWLKYDLIARTDRVYGIAADNIALLAPAAGRHAVHDGNGRSDTRRTGADLLMPQRRGRPGERSRVLPLLLHNIRHESKFVQQIKIKLLRRILARY